MRAPPHDMKMAPQVPGDGVADAEGLRERLREQCGVESSATVREYRDNNFLSQMVEAYVKRTYCEEVDELENGGSWAVLYHLGVLPKDGLLDPKDISRRAHTFGRNELPRRSLTPFWKLIWDASADPMLRILMCAAIVSLVLGVVFGENPQIEWIEGAAIFLAVCIVVLVTAANDYFKEKQFANLYAQEEKLCNAVRNGGQLQRVNITELVLGDIISLETGDEIPADAIVLSAHGLKVDESSLTGESEHIKKKSIEDCVTVRNEVAEAARPTGTSHHSVPSPILLSGSVVTSGTAKGVVVAVGIHSQIGRLFTKLTVDTEPTPLQNKLNALARDVGKLGFMAAMITLVVMLAEFWITYAVQSSYERPQGSSIANSMIDMVVVAITIIVVAVPEGLPLAVTISLAFSVGRMLKDQNYVRRLAACETMGGANEICSDKTGTLTKNQMEVEAFWNGSVLSTNIELASMDEVPLPPAGYKLMLAENIAVNSTGYLEKHEVEIADGTGRKKEVIRQVGSPTECALLLFIRNLGYDYEKIRRVYFGIEAAPTVDDPLKRPEDMVVFKLPFDSDRKVMTTVVKHPSNPKLYRVFCKGAAEVVLRRCTIRVDSEGDTKALTAAKIDRIESVIVNQLASLALRTICIAFRDFNPEEIHNWGDEDPSNPKFIIVESGLTCLGIAGIRDPVREEVPGAVRKCQEAGIRVRMCTGDNIETAKQIAIKACIYHPEKGGMAMLGPDFLKLVGGVICSDCGTEKCPCEDQEGGPPVGSQAIFVNDSSGTKGRCSRARCLSCGTAAASSDLSGVEIGEAKPVMKKQLPKRTRVDALGDQEAFNRIADRLEVLARSQPTDKYALVTGLKNRGAIVAVTGDGTNDAPALKKADVGFAMGITGKEVAKQAADIVLLDDNFESIVRACKWGRNIYDNIQRFLQFQLTVNAVAVLTAFVGAVFLRGSPLSAVQLLWVNLIMDTFAALALATELPTDKLLQRPPHSRGEYLVSKTMFRNILGQVAYQVTVMMVVIFTGECWLPEWHANLRNEADFPDFTQFSTTCGNGRTVRSGRHYHPFSGREDYRNEWAVNITPSRHYTYVFNIFVIMQVFNLLNARKIGAHEYAIFKGVLSNYYWIAILVTIVVTQALLVQFGTFALNTHVAGLTWQQWLLCFCFGFGSWIVAFAVKLLPTSFVQVLPETGAKEVSPLDEPTSLALASRGSESMRSGGHYSPGRLRASISKEMVTIARMQSRRVPIPRSRLSVVFGGQSSRVGEGFRLSPSIPGFDPQPLLYPQTQSIDPLDMLTQPLIELTARKTPRKLTAEQIDEAFRIPFTSTSIDPPAPGRHSEDTLIDLQEDSMSYALPLLTPK